MHILLADHFTSRYVLILLGFAKGQTLDCEGVTSAGDSSSGMYFLSFRNKRVPVTSYLQGQLKMSWLKGEFRAFWIDRGGPRVAPIYRFESLSYMYCFM